MVRINIKTGKTIEKQEFSGNNPEKQLQGYTEKYLQQFFRCHLLKSFYKIPGGEIDTLAITEDGVPCIIEYKHKKDQTILNQIIYYYDWLKQRSTKFEFERIVKENDIVKDIKIDWSKIRLVCVAKEYTKWDISLIKHMDTEIECWTYTYHKDELDLHLDPIINQFKKQKPQNDKISSVVDTTLEDHRNKASIVGKKLLDNLRDRVFKLGDDITEGYAPNYIKYFVNTTFLSVHVQRNWLTVQLKVNKQEFKDDKKLTKDISNRKWSLTREMKIKDLSELEYAIGLIKQAYEYQ